MINSIRRYKPQLLFVLLLLVCVLLTFINFQLIKTEQPGGDFYTNWSATRYLFTTGQSPYDWESQENTQSVFSLPLYGIFVYTPFALIKNYFVAKAIWMTLLEISIIAIVLLSQKLHEWKTALIYLVGFLLFGFFSLNGLLPLLDGKFVILLTSLVAGMLLAIQNKQDEIAGILLAAITISPVPIALFFLFIFIWVIANRRVKIVKWFLGSFFLLIGFSIVILPTWGLQFIKNSTITYAAINPGSPGGVLIDRWGDVGNRLSIVITAILSLILIIEWLQAFKARQREFQWAAMLTLAFSTWIGIKISPLDHILLLPALVMGLELICERWKQRGLGITLAVLALLFITNWVIYFLTLSTDFIAGISSFLLIPFPFTVIFLLYWSKWWLKKADRIDLNPPNIDLLRS